MFILAREDEGNRRFMKEGMPKIICRILDYPVCGHAAVVVYGQAVIWRGWFCVYL